MKNNWKTINWQFIQYIQLKTGFLTTVTNNREKGLFHFVKRQADSNADQVKTNCNTLQQMLAFFTTSSYISKIKLDNYIIPVRSKNTPGRKGRPSSHNQSTILLTRRQKLPVHPLNIFAATYTGDWVIFGVRDRPTESNLNKDELTGKTVKACCIIQTHWQKLTQGQGCPRNHWNGRNNLHCICIHKGMRSNHMVLNT